MLRRALLGVVILAAFAILVGLGTWQLERLAWKEELVAAAQERPNAAPVPAPGPTTWDDLAIVDWQYRRVRLAGRFGEGDASVWIALTEPRGPVGGPGAMTMAPFVTAEGWTVLVNRGFVPDGAVGASPPAGVVTVEGLVRPDDPPSFATPEPDLARNLFYARHIDAIARALGVSGPVAPYQVDLVAEETPAGGLPQAGESRVSFTNNHLQYALTWYGLAAALVGVVGVALVRRRSVRS